MQEFYKASHGRRRTCFSGFLLWKHRIDHVINCRVVEIILVLFLLREFIVRHKVRMEPQPLVFLPASGIKRITGSESASPVIGTERNCKRNPAESCNP